MAGKSVSYRCSECGHAAPTWTGQCSGCGAWNTLEQVGALSPARRGGARRRSVPKPVPLRDVKAERSARLGTGIAELDRVLGGGLVPGSLVLLGGAPGIGKSTLAGMALANIAGSGQAVLYVSGEESAAQVRRRAERLGDAALGVPMLAEPSLESVLAALESERPAACVIDSVQTLAIPDAAPGSVGAVRAATSALLETAKRLEVTLILIGHVTKEGSLAGPRALEHLVDCVLYFEG
ncbi:MAG: ATPase domain-containing protein, partial [Solirubrobacterales bacterium]